MEYQALLKTLIAYQDDGRIQRVLPLWEALPPLPTGWPEQFAPRKHPGIPSAA